MSAVIPLPRDKERKSRQLQALRECLGQCVSDALEDHTITDIAVNPDRSIWIARGSGAWVDTGSTLASNRLEQALHILAQLNETVANAQSPLLESVFPESEARVQGYLPGVVGSPAMTIRKHLAAKKSLDELCAGRVLEEWHVEVLRHAVRERQNILISGGTGSGKTTLANAIVDEMVLQSTPGERFVFIEDTKELSCKAPNVIALQVTDDVCAAVLVKAALRSFPDRIIFGEVRGGEAFELLDALNTGHRGGLTTLHANSAHTTLRRLELLVERSGSIVQPEVIAETIDYIVSIKKPGVRPRHVDSLLYVQGFLQKDKGYRTETITASTFHHHIAHGPSKAVET